MTAMISQTGSHGGADGAGSPDMSSDIHQRPLQAGPNRPILIVYAVAAVAIIFPLLLGVWFLPQFMFGAGVSTGMLIFVAVHWLVAVLCVPLFAGVAFTCLSDAMKPSPVLRVDQNGLSDARTGISVGWNSIVRAQIGHHRYSVAYVELTLDRPLLARRNPMRLGGGLQWRRRSDRLRVPLMLLDQKADVIAKTITVFVSSRGGDASSPRL